MSTTLNVPIMTLFLEFESYFYKYIILNVCMLLFFSSSALTKNAQLQRTCRPSEAEEVRYSLCFLSIFFLLTPLFVLAGKEYGDIHALVFQPHSLGLCLPGKNLLK